MKIYKFVLLPFLLFILTTSNITTPIPTQGYVIINKEEVKLDKKNPSKEEGNKVVFILMLTIYIIVIFTILTRFKFDGWL